MTQTLNKCYFPWVFVSVATCMFIYVWFLTHFLTKKVLSIQAKNIFKWYLHYIIEDTKNIYILEFKIIIHSLQYGELYVNYISTTACNFNFQSCFKIFFCEKELSIDSIIAFWLDMKKLRMKQMVVCKVMPTKYNWKSVFKNKNVGSLSWYNCQKKSGLQIGE